jgi:cell division protein FtsL
MRYLQNNKTLIENLKKVANIIAIAFILYLFIDLLIINNNCLLKQYATKKKLQTLQTETAILKKNNKDLENENDRLENDPSAVEKIAREKYGMQRKDEKVIRFFTND